MEKEITKRVSDINSDFIINFLKEYGLKLEGAIIKDGIVLLFKGGRLADLTKPKDLLDSRI